MAGSNDNESRGGESPGVAPCPKGIDPAVAAKSPECVTEAMINRRQRAHRQHRHAGGDGSGRRSHGRRSLPPLCSLVGPQELCRGPSNHDGLPSSTHRHVAEKDRIPQPIYLGACM